MKRLSVKMLSKTCAFVLTGFIAVSVLFSPITASAGPAYDSDFTKTSFIPAKDQILPWLLECASKMTFPMHSAWIAMWALELYEG